MESKSKGRQKIEIVKVEDESCRQVTFSKRRSSLFKKASELATLCGAEVALIVFSPAEKPFSFGNPNVEAVVDRFLNGNVPSQAGPAAHFLESQRIMNVRKLNLQLTQVLQEVEAERKHTQEVKKLLQEKPIQNWWEKPIYGLTLPQLEQLKHALEGLRKNVDSQGEQLLIEATKLTPQEQQQSFYGASSSVRPVALYNNINDSSNSLRLPPPAIMPPPEYSFGGGISRFY